MLGWWHFQNGVTHGVRGYFPVFCDICDMWCVMCDVWCDTWHVMWRVLQSHVDAGVVAFPKWCHTWGPELFSSVLWHLWHVMCDVWCVMWHMTCHVTCITIPCWCWGGDISEMVSHMGSKIVFSGLWHVWCVMWHVMWHTSVPVTHTTPDILWKF